MTEPRDDVPLADLDEQQRELESDPALEVEVEDEAGGGLVMAAPTTSDVEADEADVLEQSLPVSGTEDYPREPEQD